MKVFLKKLYILNVCELIPLKLYRELGEWWKCNKVVFDLIDCASLRCYELPKLRFCITRLRVHVFSSWIWRAHPFLISWSLLDQLKPLLCHNRSRLWDFEFHWKLQAFKWVKSSMFKFEALNILLKSLFEKTASVVTIDNTPSLSAWCVSSGNSIFALYFWTQNWWF